ncbi:MAG: Asp-tRNA(Asn)/Glu-tRNA(Gln) amidotransferase subunit GatB [Candidatus Kerfeldbacteria bacterium]|nr:Asp-tRNA(Asn)/Glu-tRNA(Gln) amidotransferase subunit GatB [Candidatus Kerfeldbacteria bacterium]
MRKKLELEAIIGLEVHVQLKTKSKMFCCCNNRDDQPPNSAICPICTGQPGTLPLPNQQAIDWAVMTALALGCQINQESKFDRKNYFYPDLPKGYQISQYDKPFGFSGTLRLPIDGQEKTFRIHRLHLEEDAGKLIHPTGADYSLVDLNRAGTPLMEIVSEPDFRTPAEAKAYVQELQLIMRYLGVSDADMEKGHLRCDANVSLRPKGESQLYPKSEVKNMNSFKAIERALAFEIERQRGLWEDGSAPTTGSTRGWNESTQKTEDQRTKEKAADYRYFPEPDIPPIIISDEHVATLREGTKALPSDVRRRLREMYGLDEKNADGLVHDPGLEKYFEEVVTEFRGYMESAGSPDSARRDWEATKSRRSQSIANWLLNRISTEHRGEHGLPVPATDIGRMLWMLDQGEINAPASTQIYEAMIKTKKGPHALMQELGLEQMSDTGAISQAVQEVMANNKKVVADVKTGKTAAMQFLVGQVMKATKGKANPTVVQAAVKKALEQ